MMKKLAAVGGLMALAGCGIADVDAIRTVEPAGTPFSNALTREYRELARFEADDMYDWPSAVHYARKGLASARSEPVQPFELAGWGLPPEHVGEMAEARGELVRLLNASARTKVPAAAADAQGKFDCWVEQQTENHQPAHIATCRTGFYAALDTIKAGMAPKPEPTPVLAPKTHTIYFGFASAAFTESARNRLTTAIAAAKEYDTPVVVIGHTDTAGSSTYNMALSRKRAEAVKAEFEKSGVADVRIITRGVGEQELFEQTPDGTRNPFNRRVTITIE